MFTNGQARRRTIRLHGEGGFTVPELIIGILFLGGFLLLSLGLVTAGRRLLPGRSVSSGNEVLPIAPSPGAFADAVRLEGAFLAHLRSARAIYVFGGAHEGLPRGASRSSGAPLALDIVPNLVVGPEESLASDAYGFYLAHAATLGAMVRDPAPADYSVLMLGPVGIRLEATALLQVRQQDLVVGKGDDAERFVRREAVLHQKDSASFRYAFLEPANRAGAGKVGARHFWYRYEEGRVAEEGPALIVLPDPWLYAGQRDAGVPIPSFSRFVHFLGVSP